MEVGFLVGDTFYQIGSNELLHAFLSTISVNFEPDGWGSKYPLITNQLYQGFIDADDIEKAGEEFSKIYSDLLNLSIDKLVWDIDDLSARPPFDPKLDKSGRYKTLEDFFITTDGNSLFEVMASALEDAYENGCDLEIETFDDTEN